MDPRLLEGLAELERERPNDRGGRRLADEPVYTVRLMAEEDHGSGSV